VGIGETAEAPHGSPVTPSEHQPSGSFSPAISLLTASGHSEGWNISPVRKGWESWGCSAWRRKDCGVTLEQLPVPGGAARELEWGW